MRANMHPPTSPSLSARVAPLGPILVPKLMFASLAVSAAMLPTIMRRVVKTVLRVKHPSLTSVHPHAKTAQLGGLPLPAALCAQSACLGNMPTRRAHPAARTVKRGKLLAIWVPLRVKIVPPVATLTKLGKPVVTAA